jgi:TonB-dependent receptor
MAPMMAHAQEATELEEIVVTGIRASFSSAMDVKRQSFGVVDGIVAEDIGKFPDTNLAESLQRISGVSIDRTLGEGSKITVRGVGPDFNLVLLNGRQMPASSIADTQASGSRAFDFANLASESISAVEVFKTSRASLPTGGIGATVNIKTARPLDGSGEMIANIGVKGVYDTSVDNLPRAIEGSAVTPEISGIFSDTFADGKFGVAISGSYQERDLGFSQAAVSNGWRPFKGDEVNWGTIPLPGAPGSENITNRPGPDDIYSVPQNLNYSVNGVQRKRTNGQLTLQYRPVEAVTATLDYTYSENKIETQRNELSAWFNFGPSVSSWTDGPVAAPIIYSETINCPGGCADLAMGGANFATKNQNDSIGFNLKWDVNDQLGLALDVHSSQAESGADSPYGSNAVLGTAGFIRGTTTADFSKDFPVLSVVLPPSLNGVIDPSTMLATGSSFRNSYMKSEIDQAQFSGDFKFADESSLDFGVSLTKAKNRSAFSNVQQDSWGGIGSPADYPDDAFRPDSIRHYFSDISGSSNPALFNQFFVWDFETIRAAAAAAYGDPTKFLASKDFTTDRRSEEESTSVYAQYNRDFNIGRPAHVALGLRYEQTDVTSKALVPIATGNWWGSQNEFSIQFGAPGFTTLKGSYDYLLPSLDFSVDVTDDIRVRASYGESIGRPGWDQIQGGQTLNQLARIDGGTGNQGNPALKPLESQNIDFSVEWYYAPGSYVSAGYFHKSVDNYIGTTTINDTPFDLPNPGAGPWVAEAVANGCTSGDTTCIRNYIFTTYAGDPAVTVGPLDSNGNLTGVIRGRPGIDPVTNFAITVPGNQRSETIDGWELALQHMFGDSGFGVSTNLTLVDSGLQYDNRNLGQQFALVGLSDSANFVGFYENETWQVRLAYNWRDEFLATTFDASGLPNPTYTEAYGQFDANFSYNITDNFTVMLEAINLTGEIQRIHGRDENNLNYVTQSGPRYMIGARYNFGK